VAVITPTTPAPSTPTRNTPIFSNLRVYQLETCTVNDILFLHWINYIAQGLIMKFPVVMGPDSSLPSSQKLIIGPFPEPLQSSSHLVFLSVNIILPSRVSICTKCPVNLLIWS
jgi:hypothetical protein